MAFTPFRPGQQSTQIQVIELQQTLLGALSGLLRLANGAWLIARNAANTGDVNLARVNGSNQIEIGTSVKIAAYLRGEPLGPSVSHTCFRLASGAGGIVKIWSSGTYHGHVIASVFFFDAGDLSMGYISRGGYGGSPTLTVNSSGDVIFTNPSTGNYSDVATTFIQM